MKTIFVLNRIAIQISLWIFNGIHLGFGQSEVPQKSFTLSFGVTFFPLLNLNRAKGQSLTG